MCTGKTKAHILSLTKLHVESLSGRYDAYNNFKLEECRFLGCGTGVDLVRTEVSEERIACIFHPPSSIWRWRRYVAPKRLFTQVLHCTTSQKTAFFIVTAAKAIHFTILSLFSCGLWQISPATFSVPRIVEAERWNLMVGWGEGRFYKALKQTQKFPSTIKIFVLL
jgi:hypothetical protein